MHISDLLKISKGHSQFDFVDISLDDDTPLFIDPCQISLSKTPFAKKANEAINDYFDLFYRMYKNQYSDEEKSKLFNHSHEINATKLGYGNGNNGKAKTTQGMLETFKSVGDMFKKGIPFSNPIDLPIFVERFSEDCMSDILTNILFSILNEYTIYQCRNYGLVPQGFKHTYYYWNTYTHSWELYSGNSIVVNGQVILLVPKSIVCKSYCYNAEHYFRHIISERIIKDQTTVDSNGKEIKPYKKDIRFDELNKFKNIRKVDIENTINDPNALIQYHSKIPIMYHNRCLTDDELDNIVYS